jgi:orotidine-5'-phosphate decarboxylase
MSLNKQIGIKELARKRLIVALDVQSAHQARELLCALRGVVGTFKIGSQLFTAAGPEIVREIVRSGERVFLDLKFHDIPSTVALAGVEATRLGVSIFNVHAAGGSEMMRRTAETVADTANAEGLASPSIIAVTVLTSTNAATLSEIGISSSPEEQVGRLSLLAAVSGMDGVVASPREVALVRSVVDKAGFLVVTPGIRPQGTGLDDQKRTMTPAEAIKAGADYLVVGRPITGTKGPAQAAEQIIDEMATGFANGGF